MPHYVLETSDYSESESEKAAVTELYRRKPTYYHNYRQRYETVPRYDQRVQYKIPNPINEPYEDIPLLKTSPSNRRSYIERLPQHKITCPAMKKFPVTVGTPRYYRYGPTTLCKKPTTLCLPVACQPDPAVYRRYSKKIDSEGDVNARLNDLDHLLTKFDDDKCDLSDLSDITKILKPKIPASLKNKHEISKLKVIKPTEEEMAEINRNISNLDIREKSLLNNNRSKITKSDDNLLKEKSNLKMKHIGPAPLDDNSAIELHQSKCYIVNLIDKALSRELGTISEEKITKKDFSPTMNPKRAVDLVNRHASVQQTDNKKICTCDNEEPLYLKQLRQLRWGHLRHIQREAKRLADLERFLDTFGDV